MSRIIFADYASASRVNVGISPGFYIGSIAKYLECEFTSDVLGPFYPCFSQCLIYPI